MQSTLLLPLSLLLATGCVPAEPPEAPSYFLSLECGKPLPTTCGTRTRSYTQLPSRVGATTTSLVPELGAMTEQAAQAKRLFDKAQWDHAVVALEAVALGAHGDDEGNRQIAEYHLAITNYILKDYEAATDLFVLIRGDETHIKRTDLLPWLFKLRGRCETSRVLRAIAGPPNDELFGFDIPDSTRRYGDFLIARGLVELGEFDEAAKLYKPLRNDVDYGYRTRQCLEWIEAQPKAPAGAR